MEREYFEWGKYSGENGGLIFPVDAMEDIFLINTKKDEVWLSKKCASLLSDGRAEIGPIITQKELQSYFSESGGHAFKQAVFRLEAGKVERVGCHASIQGRTRELSAVVYLYRLTGREELFGHISVDYEPMREYEEHLEQVKYNCKMVDLNATILILHTREACHAAVHRVSDMHVIATILIFILHINGLTFQLSSLVAQRLKCLPLMQETQV